MKKWEETTNQVFELKRVIEILQQDYDSKDEIFKYLEEIEQVSDEECDGCINESSIHDGTLLFTYDLIGQAINLLSATDTRQIGKINLQTDYIICNMKYGKKMSVSRDIVTIPFKYQEE